MGDPDGSLKNVDLGALIARFDARYLVEFGTGDGEDLAHAAGFPFEHVYSIDPSHRLAIRAAFRHARNRKLTVLHARFERGWSDAVGEIPAGSPVLFLLDGGDRLAADLAVAVAGRPMKRDLFLVGSADPEADARVLETALGATHLVTPEGGRLLACPR